MVADEQVQQGPSKLKGIAELGMNKWKKKKDKDKVKLLESMGTSKKNEEEKRHGLDKQAPARVAGEAANGKDPEESIQDPQARSGGLQQIPIII
uniref:Uncharacterized protein n=1 Tax=Rhinolophus ferrumequinum TaxID=59479 RepID=A0A671DZ63_RHIFE